MMLYALKGEELAYLCRLLKESDVKWGWGRDPACVPEDVLYIDLPTGQVSFHAYPSDRPPHPTYDGQWDGEHASQARIVAYCERLLQTDR
jgi:hypothetical protein